MRSIRFARFGEPAEVLTVEDLPSPVPGPGQVLVRMRVRPINPSDLFTIRGHYGRLPKLPATPGLEGCGVISALGEGVTSAQIGQLVLPGGASGTWQEEVVADLAGLIVVPAGLTEQQAAMLLVNPTTAWLMLNDTLKVQPGEWVIQNAANSAVGRFVIQIARLRGFKTINVVRRRELAEELRAIGADHVICETDEDVVVRVRAITAGRGANYALDSVAGESGSRLATVLAPGGTLLVFGAISGRPLSIDAGTLLFRGVSVQGWWLTHWFRSARPEQIDALFAALTPLIANGTLHAPIAAEYDLADIKAACAAADGSERNGKILLVG